MAEHVLDKYRRAQEDTLRIETVEGKPYKAFEFAALSQRRLELRPGYAAQRIVSYGYLTDIVHAGGVIIGLNFSVPILSIEIKGWNLQEVVTLLREERITALQEYIRERHIPPQKGEPIIESMQISSPGKRSKTAKDATGGH